MSSNPTPNTSANPTVLPPTESTPASPSGDPNHVIWEGTFSARGMVKWYLVLGSLTILLPLIAVLAKWESIVWAGVTGALLCLWLLCFIILKLRQWSCRYRLGETTLEIESGILNRKISPINLLYVTDVEMKQTILERIFGVGVIEVSSNDRTDPYRRMMGIKNPRSVYELIRNQWNQMVRRRGIMSSASISGGDAAVDGGANNGLLS